MFDLKDRRGKRRRVIFGHAQLDAKYGVVLAAMDFEWTCRRAILALSKKPTVVIYEKFTDDYSAFRGLAKAWQAEVLPVVEGACTLQDLVNKKGSWNSVYDAMQCRNVIVHGTKSRVNEKECRWAVCVLEDACDVISLFVEEHGKSIFERIGRARSRNEMAEESKGGKNLRLWHERVGKEIAKYDAHHWIKTVMIY